MEKHSFARNMGKAGELDPDRGQWRRLRDENMKK